MRQYGVEERMQRTIHCGGDKGSVEWGEVKVACNGTVV